MYGVLVQFSSLGFCGEAQESGHRPQQIRFSCCAVLNFLTVLWIHLLNNNEVEFLYVLLQHAVFAVLCCIFHFIFFLLELINGLHVSFRKWKTFTSCSVLLLLFEIPIVSQGLKTFKHPYRHVNFPVMAIELRGLRGLRFGCTVYISSFNLQLVLF